MGIQENKTSHQIIKTKNTCQQKNPSLMKPESPISTYKHYNTYEDIDPPYLPTKDPKFNFPEPKRSEATKKSSQRQKPKGRSGFLDCFCEVLCLLSSFRGIQLICLIITYILFLKHF